jgi:hypothetical protein
MSAADAMPDSEGRLRELEAWQAARLAATYEDLRHDPLCAAAIGFFLSDIYGAQDYSRRDQQLQRAWRILQRTLPAEALGLLRRAVELQQLTAQLDAAMAARIGAGPLSGAAYAAAYRAVGSPEARRRQVDLVLSIAGDLSRLVRHDWMALALRAAHLPAHAAGFGALQDFLERGFAAFRRMQGSERLLNAIRERETRLSEYLLQGGDDPQHFLEELSKHGPP